MVELSESFQGGLMASAERKPIMGVWGRAWTKGTRPPEPPPVIRALTILRYFCVKNIHVLWEYDTIPYDTVYLLALKSWSEGQLNLVYGIKNKNMRKTKNDKKLSYRWEIGATLCISWNIGATENVGHENVAQSNMQGWKMWDMNMRHKKAAVEKCKTWKMRETLNMWSRKCINWLVNCLIAWVCACILFVMYFSTAVCWLKLSVDT